MISNSPKIWKEFSAGQSTNLLVPSRMSHQMRASIGSFYHLVDIIVSRGRAHYVLALDLIGKGSAQISLYRKLLLTSRTSWRIRPHYTRLYSEINLEIKDETRNLGVRLSLSILKRLGVAVSFYSPIPNSMMFPSAYDIFSGTVLHPVCTLCDWKFTLLFVLQQRYTSNKIFRALSRYPVLRGRVRPLPYSPPPNHCLTQNTTNENRTIL